MQYGFYINQRAVKEMNLELDFTDLAIYEFIKSYSHSKKVVKLESNNKVYYWITWKLILEEIPMVKVKTQRSVINHMNSLIEAGLLERHEDNTHSSKSFYTFGKNYDKFEGYVGCEEKGETCENIFTPPVKQISHNHNTNISEDNIHIEKRSNAVNKFYISSTQRAAVFNKPDEIAKIKRQVFIERITPIAKEVGIDSALLQRFIDYWCECTEGTEKLRCENEEFFQVKSRMATFMRNNNGRRTSYQQPQAPPQPQTPHVWTEEELDNLYK